MNQKPLVSIGMPIYNGEKYLAQALDSLLEQEYRNFELIVSNNASTDGTESICRQYATRDQRIRYYRNRENVGALANFGMVLNRAMGDYFMWSACDDLWMPGFISATLQQLERYPAAIVAMSAIKKVSEGHTESNVIRFSGRNDPNHMSQYQLAMSLAAGRPYHLYVYGLYRTEFLRKSIQYFRPIAGGDRLFVCHAALVAPFRYVDEVLHVRQVRSDHIRDRYKKEQLGRVWRDTFAKEKMVLAAGSILFGSSLIPLRRKLLIPFVVLRFALHTLAMRLRWIMDGVRYRLNLPSVVL